MPHFKMKIKTEFNVVVTAIDEAAALQFTQNQFSNIGGEPSIQIWGEIHPNRLDKEIEWDAEKYFDLGKLKSIDEQDELPFI
ncbi:hypothetical protein QM272_15140 [Acinetobacter baumannii]|uniref:hypothetical protein n=1 Tax=Acinetobacter calcoaceticus/baumannii complex TaxID=909768 RepID=UPI00124FB9CD|nr:MULTISPECIES: hypothetical protein [Acinetobacter calcoaceticus/baumannii complex]MDI9725451.1 hypothetical protein [Acinetobacter baumannii]